MAAKTLEDFQEIALQLIGRQRDAKRAQREYERMSRLEYELPEPLGRWEWIRPIVTTAPYDALRGAVRALSNLHHVLHVNPITVARLADPKTARAAEIADQWEMVLRWELDRASRRRQDLAGEAIWSAAVYDEVIAQLIYLPAHFKATGVEGARARAALRNGNWAYRMADPKTIYMESSDFMTERVLEVSKKRLKEIRAHWGKAAARLDGEDKDYVVEYDLVGHDGRIVWVERTASVESRGKGEIILPHQPWLRIAIGEGEGEQVPFLPYAEAVGGTAVDLDPRFQRKPLLFPVYMAEQWSSANISGTLMMSEAISEAAAPKHLVAGPGADQIAVDYGEPGGRINLPTRSLHEYQRLRANELDPAMREVFNRLEASIQRATVADVLVTAQPISGEQAFASYNLQVQQALASLGGIKALGERFFLRCYEMALLVAHYTGSNLEGYSEAGEGYTIDSEDINPEAIHLEVELKADVPADRLQRVTAAVSMANALQYSPQRLLKYLGEPDPEGSLREWKLWQIEVTDLKAQLDRMARERSGEYEQDVIKAAQTLMQQMAPPEGASPNGTPPPEGPPGAAPTARPIRGELFSPGPPSYGIAPSEANPEGSTFEGATGMSRGGQPIAEVPG